MYTSTNETKLKTIFWMTIDQCGERALQNGTKDCLKSCFEFQQASSYFTRHIWSVRLKISQYINFMLFSVQKSQKNVPFFKFHILQQKQQKVCRLRHIYHCTLANGIKDF